MWKSKKENPDDEKKKALIAEGKELGLNLEMSMSLYELEHRIAEAKDDKKAPPKQQPSKVRGEH
jgi:hypothetical protein